MTTEEAEAVIVEFVRVTYVSKRLTGEFPEYTNHQYERLHEAVRVARHNGVIVTPEGEEIDIVRTPGHGGWI